MKRFLLSLVIATSLALTSCQFDDSDIWNKLGEVEESIRDHEQRISALEELCKQMNTNIEALQTIVSALEKRDYVTNVSEVRSNGMVIGYTISFAYSGAITIYHGQNGTDGYTPQIGVMQDADGIYYWTLDGEWLLDDNGNKIKANATDGKDGQNGANGSNGANGTDGVTPLLKIENDYWFVSYDNGASWVQLGKATGDDGIDGENGEDGDSIFKSVTQDDEYVYFNLADGTVITLPKGDKKTTVDDVCSLMEDITFMKYCYDNFDANKDGMLSQIEAASVYTIDIGGLDIYSLAGIEMFTRLESIIAKNCSKLREVVIPNTITSIGNEAFYGCSCLASVTIPESVTSIGKSAFYNCSKLTSVTIPEGVTSIGESTFYNCSALKNVTIPDSVTSIGSSAFYNCTSLASVTIPDRVTSIGGSAFNHCTSLTSVTIGNSVTSIGDYAFYYCDSLTSVTIPDSVTLIGEYAFYGCDSLTSVDISDLSAWCKISFGNSNASPLCYGAKLYLNGSELTNMTIPSDIAEIKPYAFRYCTSLTSITIPDSVTTIGGAAFYSCTSLISVYCKPTTPPTAGYNIFYNNASDRKIYVPAESVEAYKSASGWNSYASDIVGYDFEKGEIVQPEQPGDITTYLFYENCGEDVEKVTTSSGSTAWPYIDQFTGWTPEGDAATNVTYKGQNASVRASGNAYQPTADAVGVSGAPYVFLNKVPAQAYFVIENIAVTGGSNYIFTYNVSCQNAYNGGTPGFATVDGSLVHLELGYDGQNWDAVECTFAPNGGNGWYAVQAEFKVKADATVLYARFTYEAPASNGGCRFDDFKLVEGGNGADLAPEAPQQPEQPELPTDPLAIPYSEPFATTQGFFTTKDVVLGEGLTYVWKHDAPYAWMKASAYKIGAQASESWLISPEITLAGATAPAVSFEHCHRFAGTPTDELTLWISEDKGANWNQLTIPVYGSNKDYTFVANTIDLTSYVGKTVQIAFKYVATSANAATWEVRNFKVAEGNGPTVES